MFARIALPALAMLLASTAATAQDVPAPTAHTLEVYASAGEHLDWNDERDFAAAERGLIARYPDTRLVADDGHVVWAFPDYQAMRHAPPPEGVHPVLWRQARLNAANGLFEVVPGVYQLRGFDLANMTIVEGDTGIIVIDPLTAVESARAGLELYYAHRPQRPVVAVIYTHSHVDHFGGVRGVVDEADVLAGRVQVIAPAGFLHEAISENVTAGNAMFRRTIYYSGIMVPPEQRGSLGAGLGPGVANGQQTFIAPTEELPEQGGTRVIDGVTFQFRGANGTEAPSELMFYLPQFGVLDVAEVATRTVHNLLTPRGAQVRDAARWWQAIDAVLTEFGGQNGSGAQVMVGSHHWPSWGGPAIREQLENQRDFYKFVHDRSLYLANNGETMDEIAAELQLPPSLASQWTLQDYYGTLGSGGRAVFQRYLGWYDGNPANLNRLPPVDSAQRTIAYMGGADAVLARARADYDAGDYQWVAQVVNQLLFAEPDNLEARALQADALTQLGYQQVSASWRNVYLTAARELRQGVVPIPITARSGDYVTQMSPAMLFDYAGIALSAERSAGARVALVVEAGDGDPLFAEVRDGLLRYRRATGADTATRIVLAKPMLEALLTRRIDVSEAVERDELAIDGDRDTVSAFFDMFDSFTPGFNLVTP
ncbi:MAG: MBL fold metallo-hydrolase [Erythrobacter sp.]|nr:MBL fold metallo-hydrolase [Erythrobacter sp.]